MKFYKPILEREPTKRKYIIKNYSYSKGKLWVYDDDGLGEYINAGSQLVYEVANPNYKFDFNLFDENKQNLGSFSVDASTEIENGEIIKLISVSLHVKSDIVKIKLF